MRIIFAQDLNPLSHDGGAQLNDRGMIREGMKRGHEIVILTPDVQNELLIEPKDFLIFSNISLFEPAKLAKIHEKNRYAVFHHDFWFRCRWRLYFPMSEKCDKDCPQAPIFTEFLKNAALHIFLSPLHHRLHKEYFGEAVEPSVLVPSAVNPDLFLDQKRPDRKGSCSINGLIQFKGRDNILEYAKTHLEESITFGGDNQKPDEPLPPNCKFVGPIPGPKLMDFYNQHEWYLELPDTSQPFNRTVVEAYLSGCKIRGNDLVGALSWPWMSSGRQVVAEKLRHAPADFWNSVEAIL